MSWTSRAKQTVQGCSLYPAFRAWYCECTGSKQHCCRCERGGPRPTNCGAASCIDRGTAQRWSQGYSLKASKRPKPGSEWTYLAQITGKVHSNPVFSESEAPVGKTGLVWTVSTIASTGALPLAGIASCPPHAAPCRPHVRTDVHHHRALHPRD